MIYATFISVDCLKLKGHPLSNVVNFQFPVFNIMIIVPCPLATGVIYVNRQACASLKCSRPGKTFVKMW